MAEQSIKLITSVDLLSETLRLKTEGYRLVAISCTNKNGMELTYSFDKDYDFIHLRFTTDTKEEISSISFLYPFSFLYENEIKELFGVQIIDMSMDFKDKLYRISTKTPFNIEKEAQ